jgi:radical SAM superfamily enzyme YgiQ (UPF0313 family)
MKIVIGYPPLESKKGVPLLSQNRQFQWFRSPTYIYPIVPAYAATMLKEVGHEVIWLDGIAENWTLSKWMKELKKVNPDLLLMETKTPVIKRHWEIISRIKNLEPRTLVVLVGDHVTALAKESFEKSKVDQVLTGGDFDFLLLNLLGFQFEKLPMIDRELTKWQLYAYKNGNYRDTPATYIMAGRDCWYRKSGGCSFCSWASLYPQWKVRKVNDVLEEIGELINCYGVKEIFDDTGTFPVGNWLKEFCKGMVKNGYHQQINFGCNMRFGVLSRSDYQLMAKANFRLLLFGYESANQKTLDRLNKGVKVKNIKKELEIIKEVNKETGGQLEPHLTVMLGYPWETKKDAEKTVSAARDLLTKGLASSLQATLIIPYPGTALFKEAEKNNWLKTKDWNKYDMSEPVLKTKISDRELKAMIRKLYSVAFEPQFLLRKALKIRSWKDLKNSLQAGLRVIGHLIDFGK